MTDAFTLVINNSNVSNRNTNATFTYNFIGGGFNVDDNTMVMVSSAQIPYSIFNITAAYNNNSFTLGFPTGAGAGTYTNFTVVIPDGFYTIEDLNSFMQQFAITNGLYLINDAGENVYYTPAFYVNQVSYAIQILLYTVPRALPANWTQPTNWIGSQYDVDAIAAADPSSSGSPLQDIPSQATNHERLFNLCSESSNIKDSNIK